MTREVVVAASSASVWRALTDPSELGAWFGAAVEIDVRIGGAARFRFPDGTERRGIVLDLDAPHRLAFRWRPVRGALAEATVVTFELRPDGDQTRVVVTESPGILSADRGAEVDP